MHEADGILRESSDGRMTSLAEGYNEIARNDVSDWMRDMETRANADVSGRLKAHWNACSLACKFEYGDLWEREWEME